jgi:N-acetylglucosamine-6-phosphate deacetylase
LYISFIADGVHVPFVALGNYLRCSGERAFIVTDAIRGAGLGPGEYSIGNQRVVVDENLATWSEDRSHLVGSAGTMPRSAENLRSALNLSDEQIERLMVENPRRILEGEMGRKSNDE